ncbi:MAG: YdcH family protein [Bryobacterales bacterium]|nr:YdcH family protein [Bryobacterales bacterium]MCC7236767.1 YdcH family protein [Bryobacterales bacterium]
MDTLKTDEELKAHLMMTHPEFRMNFEQHHEFELRLNDLEAKGHLSEDEQMEEVRLKKLKLHAKDRMLEIMARYRTEHVPA